MRRRGSSALPPPRAPPARSPPRVLMAALETPCQVSTVKDPTSDMATCAKNGSAVVARQRDQKERTKMRTKYWEIGGSRIGDAMGVKKEESAEDAEGRAAAEAEGEDGSFDYKESAGFAKHMKEQRRAKQEKQEGEQQGAVGASDFSRNKTITEQRQYLPVFSVTPAKAAREMW